MPDTRGGDDYGPDDRRRSWYGGKPSGQHSCAITGAARRLADGPRGNAATDRGASTLELALLTPILLLVILLVVQFAMVYHARHVALAAAQSGARIAREQSRGDWKGAAEATARDYVQRIGPALLTEVVPQAGGDRNQRWVTVTGTAVRVVPFLTFRVSQRSGGPIECYRPDVGAGTTCQDQPRP